MELAMVGMNFRTAPLELREKVTFPPADIPQMLGRMGARLPGAGIALLCTCNRTEVYALAEAPELRKEALVDALLAVVGLSGGDEITAHLYERTGVDALEHLIAVTASLDSMVVGETEILGQVKQAYRTAVEVQRDRKFLHGLFQGVLSAGKRVHSETGISRGRVSVSSVAVSCAEKIFERLASRTVMVVGAGDTSEKALKTLVEKDAGQLFVLNRSADKAKRLAEHYGGEAVSLHLLPDYLPRADIVISSTQAPYHIIDAGTVRKAMEVRRGRPMLLIDIAVPRDIDRSVGELQDVHLYDIDDLRTVAEEGLLRRQAAVEAAWRVVREETQKLAEALALRGG